MGVGFNLFNPPQKRGKEEGDVNYPIPTQRVTSSVSSSAVDLGLRRKQSARIFLIPEPIQFRGAMI